MIDVIERSYFGWLSSFVDVNPSDYEKLLLYLFRQEFHWNVPMDENRYTDGINLRDEYYRECCPEDYVYDFELYLDEPCSMLEMMIALAMRCEDIMINLDEGPNYSRWFWNMIESLGLKEMDDNHYDENYISDVMVRFMSNDYDPDGKGGLFTINGSPKDLRDVEIWYQMCWYLDYILKEEN